MRSSNGSRGITQSYFFAEQNRQNCNRESRESTRMFLNVFKNKLKIRVDSRKFARFAVKSSFVSVSIRLFFFRVFHWRFRPNFLNRRGIIQWDQERVAVRTRLGIERFQVASARR